MNCYLELRHVLSKMPACGFRCLLSNQVQPSLRSYKIMMISIESYEHDENSGTRLHLQCLNQISLAFNLIQKQTEINLSYLVGLNLRV